MQKKKYKKTECTILYTNQDDWFQEELERFAEINDSIDADVRGENNDTVRKNNI